MVMGSLRMAHCDPALVIMNRFWAIYETFGFTIPLATIIIFNGMTT